MNCKFCNAELPDYIRFCPACGQKVETEEQPLPEESAAEEIVTEEVAVGEEIPVAVQEPAEAAEEAPAAEVKEEKKSRKTALAVVAVVLVLAILVAIVVGALGGEELFTGTGETIAPTADVEATEGTIPPDGNPDDVTCKGSYTVTDDEAVAAADTVVATMGDRELTVGQLQVYYWMEVVYFLQDYSSYLSYVGLDLAQPLDTQLCTLSDTQMTWQQFFLSCALDTWRSYQAMALEAEAAGVEINAETRAELDTLADGLEEVAVGQYGLANADELLKVNYGPACTVQGYVDFWTLYYAGLEYYNTLYQGILPTADEVQAYYAENAELYEESEILQDGSKYVDVRHILVLPEGGTTDEETGETTFTEDEWEACRVKAQELLDLWLEGDATEDTFAELATEHTEDPGSAATGGLYTDVYVGQMVEPFENWCFDESRKTGDYGLVRTEYGYHIMYFVDSVEIWYDVAEADLVNERSSALIPAAMEKYPAEIDYSAIALGLVALS